MTVLRKVYVADEVTNKTVGVRPLAPADTQGALNIHDLDNHRRILVAPFTQRDSVVDTLAVAASVGDTAVTVTNGAQFTVGQEVFIEEGNVYQPGTVVITLISVNILTLDRPLDSAYTTSATVEVVNTNLVTTTPGSLGAPQIFCLRPPPGGDQSVWHIDRLLISATSASALDDSKFVSINPLPNGLTMRELKSQNFTLNNWKTNSEMRLSFYDISYVDKTGGGLNGMSGRYTFKRVDTIVEIDGSQGEELQLLVQDDLTGITSLKVTAQGHFAAL
jgi:hypothetical protein